LGKSLGKLGAHRALFSPLPRRSSLRPKQWKIVGQILVLGQSVVASMRDVADDEDARYRVCYAGDRSRSHHCRRR
jgi:hypothetical protein